MRLARFLTLMVAAVLAAAVIYGLATLPPRALQIAAPVLQGRSSGVRGAFHIHTNRSDGTGTPDEIAAAAAQAGLALVVLTDHGDGTRSHEPPRYRSGVLCVDGVEISTTGGHYIALGMRPAPYPLAGEPRDVIQDVARLGGFGIAAHPGSSKSELRWREWTAPFDGLEWLNADSEWRDEDRPTLARALLHYPFRAPETLTSLIDRPTGVLARWDALTLRRRIVALAGVDAHARIGPAGDADPDTRAVVLRMPSYEASFQTFSIRVLADRALSGRAEDDGDLVLKAIGAGHVFTSIDGLAEARTFSLSATSGRFSAIQGDELTIDGPVRIHARADVPVDASTTLFRNGVGVLTSPGGALDYTAPPEPAVFRIEITRTTTPGSGPVPWILSNPIYARAAGTLDRPILPRAAASAASELAVTGWRVERQPASDGRLEAGVAGQGQAITFRYRLAPGLRSGQYAALVIPGTGAAAYDRVSFSARADRPMRLSVQVRTSEEPGERWQRSVYLDQQWREGSVFFDELTPVGMTATRRPNLAAGTSLLLVVDTTNTPPGRAGWFTLARLRFER